jgi:hypothetical protein
VVLPSFVRFVRTLGPLSNSAGQGAKWQVIAHEGSISHDAIAAWRTSLITEPGDSSSLVASPPDCSTGFVSSPAHVASLPEGGASSSSAASPPLPPISAGSAPVPRLVASPPVPVPVPVSVPRCSALKLLRSNSVLQQAADLYELGDVIAEGTYSHVFVAKRQTSASDEPFNLAVKRLKSTHLSEAVCEAYVLDRCRPHQHIVQLIDIFEGSEKRLHMVFEHAGTDLSRLLAPLPTSAQTRSVASHICSALMHLHSLGLLHTDLKPGNVMVSADASGWRCRLADFGCAIEATGLYSMIVVAVVITRQPFCLTLALTLPSFPS